MVGTDSLTCIQILYDPDNGPVLQLMSMLGKDEHSHLEKEIMVTNRRVVRELLGQKNVWSIGEVYSSLFLPISWSSDWNSSLNAALEER